MTMPRLVVCADDFALSRPISETIATLAREGRINAVSCMAVCPGWARDAGLLHALPAHVQVGLHVTLTGEAPLTDMPEYVPAGGTMPGIDPLTAAAAEGALALEEIAGEIDAQFRAFRKAMGRAPDFVDAHQHAHVLPGIRSLFLDAVAEHAPGAWVRDCGDRVSAIAARPWRGKAIGSAYHARGLRRAAARRGIACNSSFAGHYDFRGDYERIFPTFLRRPGTMHLIMCHPGAGELPGDDIAGARPREAAALHRMRIADMARAHGLEFDA